MSKKNVDTLDKNFKSTAALEMEVTKLRQENKALNKTIDKLMNELDKARNVQRPKAVKIELTPEQRILEMQIMRLEALSQERALTLDETRMLDIHIKNKRLLDDKSTINAEYKNLLNDIPEDELLRIAESVEKEEPKKPKRRKS